MFPIQMTEMSEEPLKLEQYQKDQRKKTSIRREEDRMSEQLILEPTPLNAIDRCDRCGAQAYVRATLLNGGELLFCGHHAKEYAEGLKPVVAKIQDETNKLAEVASDAR